MEHQASLFTSSASTDDAISTPTERPTGRPSPRLRSPKPVTPQPPRQPTSPATGSGSMVAKSKLLLTEREAAKALSISSRTLWTLRTEGHIPHVRLGRAVRYDPDDLAAWVKDQRTIRGGNN